MIPAFIMIGSMIIPATSAGCSSRSRATPSRSLKLATRVRSVMARGMPVEEGTLFGRCRGPTASRPGMTDTWTELWWPW